jgi:tetratricopeptide (TPR) repeat protein
VIARRPALAGASFVALAAAVTSANALLGGFVFDDVQNVLQNPWVQAPSRILEAFGTHLAGFDPKFSTSYYRPLFHVFLVTTKLVAGFTPWAFHLVNVVMHVASSVLVFLLATRMLADREASSGALLCGLVFAVHPIHTESVAWICGITDLSYVLFILPALLLAASTRTPSKGRAAAIGLLTLLALLCKEPAVTVYAALAALYAARGDLRDPGRRSQVLRISAALAVAIMAYLAMRITALHGLVKPGARRVDPDGLPTVLTGLALLAEYVRKLVVPSHLSALHDFRVVTDPLDVRALTGAAIVIAVGAVAWRARRNAVVLVGLTLLIVPILPALYLPALGEGLFADRYLYLPSAGAALLAGYAWDRWAEVERARAPARALAAAVLLVFAAATIQRNAVWHDHLSLWTDTVAKTPTSAAAHEYLGFALLSVGRLPEAASELERVVYLAPERVDAQVNLASTLTALGRSAEALPRAMRAVQQRPQHAEAHAVLAQALVASGRLEEAVPEYRAALRLNPALAIVHDALGRTYARLGARLAAVAEFREAVRLEPSNPTYARDLEIVER